MTQKNTDIKKSSSKITEMKDNVNRLYKDLAWLWPIWEDVEEYKEESELFAELIKQNAKIEVRSLLDIGCGGGKFMFHLKKYFQVAGVDISKPMLSNAKRLNPECTFYNGDMHKFDLRCQFDSVLIDDSITYITTKEDLRNTFLNAYKHLKDGGVMITFPDVCKESFVQNKTDVSTSRSKLKLDNIDVTFVVNNYDPDPKDDVYESSFIYLIRENGKLRIEHDFHVCGIFPLDFWRKSLLDIGFEVTEEKTCGHTENLPAFVCLKPI